MAKLTDAEVQGLLQREPSWKLQGGKLEREWTFEDFVEAMGFVEQIAVLAEAANHHPDIDIRYNKVRLGLISHDAAGITERDGAMATRISRQFPA